MVIKSSKEYHVLVAILFCIAAAFPLMILYIANNVIVPAIVALFLVIIVFRYWISVGRTLIFDEKGCTVQFLWIRRHYKWASLKTKRMEDYRHSLGYRQPYLAGAVFSSKQIRKPSWSMPAEYSMFVHPFSFIFVYFDPHINYKKLDYRCPDLYVADETVFRRNMADWNVELL